MKKPVKKTRTYLEWNEVGKYINEVTGRDIDDWQGKFAQKKIVNHDVEYECFWHWIQDKYEPTNGSSFTLHRDVLDYASEEQLAEEPDFVKEIHEIIFREFEEYVDEHGYLEFEVSW